MKIMMHNCATVGVMLFAVPVIFPLASVASVLGEARYLMRAPNDVNGDGYLSNSVGEIPDALCAADAGSALNGGHSNAQNDNLEAVLIATECVTNVYTGFVDNNVPCLKMTASPRFDGDTVTYRPQSVQLPSLFDYTYTNDYTFAVRFKFDGMFSGSGKNTEWNRLLLLGLNEVGGGGGSGMSFGFGWSTESYVYHYFSFGGYTIKEYIGGVGTNKWMEVVGVMDGHRKKLTVYTAISAFNIKTNVYDYPASTETVGKPYSSAAKIGYVDWSSWNVPQTGLQSFKGSIAQLAIWDRALSGEEAIEVMSAPQPYSWKIGEDDGSSGEFAGTAPGVCCAVGQSWTALPNALTADCSDFEVMFPHDRAREISAQYPARNVLVSFKMSDDSSAGAVRLSVNGNSIKDISVSAGRKYVVLVRSEFVRDDNMLSILRLGGESLKFDWIAGGGSWQVGYRDGDYTKDGFAAQGIRYHRMENPSFGTFSRNLTGPGNGAMPVDFYVSLPQEYCDGISFAVKVGWWHMLSSTVCDSVFLNGVNIGDITLGTSLLRTELKIPQRLLRPGINHFRLARTSDEDLGTADWDPVDYVSLEPLREISGMILIYK